MIEEDQPAARLVNLKEVKTKMPTDFTPEERKIIQSLALRDIIKAEMQEQEETLRGKIQSLIDVNSFPHREMNLSATKQLNSYGEEYQAMMLRFSETLYPIIERLELCAKYERRLNDKTIVLAKRVNNTVKLHRCIHQYNALIVGTRLPTMGTVNFSDADSNANTNTKLTNLASQ